jgi:hypothetical protein
MANSFFIARRSERLDRKYLAAALAAHKVYHYASTKTGLPHSQVMLLLGRACYFYSRCSQAAKLEYQAIAYGWKHKMPPPATGLGSVYRLVKEEKTPNFSCIARIDARL